MILQCFLEGNENVANTEGNDFLPLLAIRFAVFFPSVLNIPLRDCQMDFTDINTELIGKFQVKILSSTNLENLISL